MVEDFGLRGKLWARRTERLEGVMNLRRAMFGLRGVTRSYGLRGVKHEEDRRRIFKVLFSLNCCLRGGRLLDAC